MFERLLPESFFGNMFEQLEPTAEWVPACDVTETDSDYIVRLEAPGVHKENLDVRLSGDLLTITGKRERMEEKQGETHLWREREMGKFVRTMRLAAPVEESKIEATYEDGVLNVRLPKVAQAVENKIAIR